MNHKERDRYRQDMQVKNQFKIIASGISIETSDQSNNDKLQVKKKLREHRSTKKDAALDLAQLENSSFPSLANFKPVNARNANVRMSSVSNISNLSPMSKHTISRN
jgi:hypothetical protein